MATQYKDFSSKRGLIAEGGNVTVKSGFDLILENNLDATTATIDGQLGAATFNQLTVAGILYPTADGSANHVMVTNGAGTLSFVDVDTISGSVDSVAMTVPTGLSVSGSPITSSGTLAVTYQAGYSIPTDASQANWNTAFGWGDHSVAGYLTTETDPIFTASAAAGITAGNITNWNTAFGWGDHSVAGYLTTETDPVFTASPAGGITAGNITNWDTAFGWGDHSVAGYALASNIGNGTVTVSTSGQISGSGTFTLNQAGNTTIALSHAVSGVTAGTVGSASEVPVLTIDAEGHITATSVAAISTSFTISDGTTSDTITGGETMTFTGGTDITTTVTDNEVTFNNTSTLDTVTGRGATTANDIQVGNIRVEGGTITGPATLTIDPDAPGSTGTVIIAGNLTVQGTTTTVSSETVTLADNVLLLNSNETGTPSQNAGLEVERGTDTNVSLLWDEATDRWTLTNDGTTFGDILTTTDNVVTDLSAPTDSGTATATPTGAGTASLSVLGSDGVETAGAGSTITLGLGNEITIGNNVKVGAAEATGAASATFIFPTTSTGAKMIIAATDTVSATNKQITEVLVTHDGTDVYIVEYGTVFTVAEEFTITASIVGSNVEVVATATAGTKDFTGTVTQVV